MTYIKQRDLLDEIWASKLSYCQIVEPDFLIPDVVVSCLSEVTDPGVTVRLDTQAHIPLTTGDVGKGKHGHLEGRITFDPFILYRSYVDEVGGLAFRETARSHHRDGAFSPAHGRITNRLGSLLYAMVESYARKGSWRGYSWVDEMASEALLNLTLNVLKFNDAKTSNAHAYITRCVQTTFIRELRRQKRQGAIKDQILMMNGMNPSFGATVEGSQTKKKIGRPKKNSPQI